MTVLILMHNGDIVREIPRVIKVTTKNGYINIWREDLNTKGLVCECCYNLDVYNITIK